MAKKPIQRSSVFPYHLTARSNNQEWFYLPTENVWAIMCQQLFTTTVVYSLKVHAFVLMSNHFHLVASTPEANIDSAMNYFMREVSRSINYRSERKNHVFGGPYKWSLIESPLYYSNVINYVYMNPVQAKICSVPEEYSYSTLSGILGSVELPIPLQQPHAEYGAVMPTEPIGISSLLGDISRNGIDFDLVRLGLRRKRFKLPQRRKK
jgi:REP element-mobilizing transposase RayT